MVSSYLIHQFIPPAARHLANRLAGALIRYRGPYPDWNSARAATAGYDSADILARVVDATERVLRGEAEYEQDGFAKHGTPEPSHALTALLLAASLDPGGLSVLDYGGGLGSHYLKWRRWLSHLSAVHWHVIEQPEFVAAAQPLFQGDACISFAHGLEHSVAPPPNAVLASGVLQYLPDPLGVLDALLSMRARIFIIDRTPYSRDGEHHVLTQHVPRQLGTASYPLWALSREEVYTQLRGQYVLLTEFTTPDAPICTGKIRADYAGSVWLRRTTA